MQGAIGAQVWSYFHKHAPAAGGYLHAWGERDNLE